MANLICYNWILTMDITDKKGKVKRNYQVPVLGANYQLALFDAKQTLRKRRKKLLTVTAAKVNSIAFALDEKGEFVKLSLNEHPALIPENLNPLH